MKKRTKLLSFLLAASVMMTTVLPVHGAPQAVQKAVPYDIVKLSTNYMENPLGINAEKKPVFSWQMHSAEMGAAQSAYRIVVTDHQGKTVWDSGKTESGESVGIAYKGENLSGETRYQWQVEVWNQDGDKFVSEKANFETALKSDADWDGAQLICLAESESAPVFRTEKTLQEKVKSARLYVGALGIFEAYINGQNVGSTTKDGIKDEHMAPGYYNDFANENGYRVYDVTSYLTDTEQMALAIQAGTGWTGGFTNGKATPAIKAKLEVVYENGTSETIVTDDEHWKGTLEGGITYNSIYNGEKYNAVKEKALGNYKNPGYDDSGWNQVTVKEDYRGTFVPRLEEATYIQEQYTVVPQSVTVYTGQKESSDYAGGEIRVDSYAAYQKPTDALYRQGQVTIVPPGQSLFGQGTTLRAGQTMVLDMGQNAVGIPKIQASAAEETVLTMKFAERLNDGSKRYTDTYDGDNKESKTHPDALYAGDGPKGSVYLKSLRGAKAQAEYIFCGEEKEFYQPQMTYFGYQYVSLTADKDITVYGLETKVVSSVAEQTGFIETNNKNVNRLFSNGLWGQLGNYYSVPTDCPQRDERQAWTGDTQVFCQTGLYNFDAAAFLSAFESLIRQQAASNNGVAGAVTLQSEQFQKTYAAGWSDVALILPWTLYQQTGSKEALEECWDAMKQYMDWQIRAERKERQNHPLWGEDTAPDPCFASKLNPPFDQYVEWGYISPMYFGDWLAYQGTSIEVMYDLYYGYDFQIMVEAAKALGKETLAAEYEYRLKKVGETFIKNHVTTDADGKITVHSEKGTPSSAGKGGTLESNSQTALIWMLKLGFYSDEDMKQQLMDMLIENIKNENPSPDSIRAQYGKNTLSVGFLGSNVIMGTLSEAGYTDVAYDLLLQDENPSWLKQVKEGATTIWERWNSYTSEDGFGHQEMNSFNHYSYGSVVEWMYKYMAGISADPKTPGFKHTILAPIADKGQAYNGQSRINRVKGRYDSYYGTILSQWKATAGEISAYSCTVPANTMATLYLPIDQNQVDDIQLPEGAVYAGRAEKNGMDCAKFELTAGSYSFEIPSAANASVTAAKKEAEKAKAEADAAKIEAENARKQAQEANARAEEAKRQAEEAKQAAQKAQDALNKASADTKEILAQAKANAEAKIAAAEQAKAEAEAKAAAAEKAQKDAIKAQQKCENVEARISFEARKVSIKSLKSSKKKQAVIKWKKISQAEGYQIRYSLYADMKKAKSVTVKGNKTFTKSLKNNLKSKKNVYVRIRAYRTIDGKKAYTAYSAKKRVKVK